jgi:hypothetical protein
MHIHEYYKYIIHIHIYLYTYIYINRNLWREIRTQGQTPIEDGEGMPSQEKADFAGVSCLQLRREGREEDGCEKKDGAEDGGDARRRLCGGSGWCRY